MSTKRHSTEQPHIPRLKKERLQNEADCLQFIKRVCPDIPVPTVHGAFEIDGVTMSELETEEKSVVTAELEKYLGMLKEIKSDTIGSPEPEGVVIPPHRVMDVTG